MAHTSEFLDLRRSDSERLRVTVSEYRGRTLINAASNIVVDYLKLKEVPDTWALEDGDTPSPVPGQVRRSARARHTVR
ncbi:hypothetical protein [Burkholderia gladioli]|uniref:hypothetical protein n=1 Tax=Burkholderia gladioli TaxID=28095 RepID=UPI002FE11C51